MNIVGNIGIQVLQHFPITFEVHIYIYKYGLKWSENLFSFLPIVGVVSYFNFKPHDI